MNLGRTFAVVAAILSFGIAQSVAAATTISLVWRANGTDTIDPGGLFGAADAPDHLDGSSYNLDVVLTTDSAAITGVFVSILFDTDGEDELDYLGGAEFASVLLGKGNSFAPLAAGFSSIQESTAATTGVLLGFDQATLATGLVAGSATLGSLKFAVNMAKNLPAAGDIDVIAAILPNGVDALIGAGGANISGDALFTGAQVVGVPEPTTALLVVLGLGGLGFAGRRSIR